MKNFLKSILTFFVDIDSATAEYSEKQKIATKVAKEEKEKRKKQPKYDK